MPGGVTMLTNKVLWTIERHLDRPLTLGELAHACGVRMLSARPRASR